METDSVTLFKYSSLMSFVCNVPFSTISSFISSIKERTSIPETGLSLITILRPL